MRIEYVYDPFHRRLSKTISQKCRVDYIWDGDNEIGAVTEGEIAQLRVLGEGFGAEIGAAVFYELDGETYVPIHDHRGCVVAIADMNGKTLENYRYTAFGEELTAIHLSPWRFSSKRAEEETGLVFFGRRYYFPELGKWITQDPEGFEDGPNLYSYVANRPLTHFDLYGLMRDYLYDYDALDFPGLSYSTLLKSQRISPYFFGYENGFTNRSTTYDLKKYGRPDLPKDSWIGLSNGINNTLAQAERNLLYLSDCAGGYNLYGMYRGSQNIPIDAIGCWMGYQGTITNAVQSIHQAWDEQFARAPESLLLHFCTSGGAISTKQALKEYDERRQNIRVVAIAPADYISRDLCHSVQHYTAHAWRDLVPWIRWGERWKNRDTVKVLPSHPDAPWHDHSITSKTYEKAIRYEIRYYLDLIGK